MIDYRLVELFERIGYVNEHGERVYGSAAVTHYVYCPAKDFVNQQSLELGKAFVQKYLPA